MTIEDFAHSKLNKETTGNKCRLVAHVDLFTDYMRTIVNASYLIYGFRNSSTEFRCTLWCGYIHIQLNYSQSLCRQRRHKGTKTAPYRICSYGMYLYFILLSLHLGSDLAIIKVGPGEYVRSSENLSGVLPELLP